MITVIHSKILCLGQERCKALIWPGPHGQHGRNGLANTVWAGLELSQQP